MINRLIREQVVPAPLNQVWKYFATPANLNNMTPQYMNFDIIHGGGDRMYPGMMIEYCIQFMPVFKSRWLTEITYIQEESYFVDEQRLGPYRIWHHEHHFESLNGGTRILDLVTYELPFGLIGDMVHAIWVRSRLTSIFDFRRAQINFIFSA